jgi:hypothetical protein
MSSVFAEFTPQAWPYRFAGTLHIRTLAGGIPSDPKVAEGWLRTKLAGKDDLIRDAVAEVMAERGITAEEAARELDRLKHLNGFKRDSERDGELYIEGRQLKAAIKESASVAAAASKLPIQKWGKTNKWIFAFVAEHIQVLEERLYLGVTEPSDVLQSFPKNERTGKTGIQYTEICQDVKTDFTVISDHDFSAKDWAMLWLTAEQQGIGASRSQNFGRYEVVRWERVKY